MSKRPRSSSEIQDQLTRSVKFLKRSLKHFDEGDEEEASRIAVELRKLLHDARTSHSILKQLGLKETLRFHDSGRYRERFDAAANRFAEIELGSGYEIAGRSPVQVGLVFLGVNGRAPQWYAPLGLRHDNRDWRSGSYQTGPRPFDEWWSDPLIEGSSGRSFSRKDLVLLTANQESGAHVDPEIDVGFDDLSKDMMGVSLAIFGRPPSALELHNAPMLPPMNNIVYPSIRQIADEVLKTLDPHYNLRRSPLPEFLTSSGAFGRRIQEDEEPSVS
ncbi:hypothetical protein [Rhizobium leguminosarum]|uniref:hypothetical protein n=1 Tax=Rhizobium leguminosarum TaxID=384 RepID=UPI001C946156|nr:hypothetical protein [Rhizobium leguminosarum]MBY5694698.1 hypothetical protein [Rhizobium leguminosarum]